MPPKTALLPAWVGRPLQKECLCTQKPSLQGGHCYFCGLTQSAQIAPAVRGHHVGYRNLMGGRPVVAGAGHESPHGRLATMSGHTCAHRGCSWLRLVALTRHTAAVAGSSCTGRHIQVVPHRLYSQGWLPGTGPSTVVDTAGRTDSGCCDSAGGIVVARKNAAGPGAGRKLHCSCTLLGCLLQAPMARPLHLLGRQERHHYIG